MVSAIVLAGGLGTRLQTSVPHLPKSLALIQNTPFFDLFLTHLSHTPTIQQVIFALGYRSEQIEAYLHSKTFPFSIEISKESSPMGTGGALLLAKEKATFDVICAFNGDTFCDLAFDCFFDFHKKHNADVSIASRYVDNASRYGSLNLDSSRRILAFEEKKSSSSSGWVNAGIYFFHKQLLSSFPIQPCSIETDIFPSLLQKRLFAYPHTGIFIDIGTEASYLEAQTILQPWI